MKSARPDSPDFGMCVIAALCDETNMLHRFTRLIYEPVNRRYCPKEARCRATQTAAVDLSFFFLVRALFLVFFFALRRERRATALHLSLSARIPLFVNLLVNTYPFSP